MRRLLSVYTRPKVKFPRKLLRELMLKMGGKCGYCGTVMSYPKKGDSHQRQDYKRESIATVDHIVPLSKGGPHNKSNMICCCFGCNAQKSNRDLDEFRLYFAHKILEIPLFSKDQKKWLEENEFTFPEMRIPFWFEELGFAFSPGVGLQERA